MLQSLTDNWHTLVPTICTLLATGGADAVVAATAAAGGGDVTGGGTAAGFGLGGMGGRALTSG
jgi:hypothetical protein